MSFLLDTNVISELVAPKPNLGVIRWLEGLDQESIFLSVITIGELKSGIEKLSDSERKRTLSDWLTGDLLIRFGDQVLPIDVSVILTWGTLVATIEAKGKPIPAIDSLLAAMLESIEEGLHQGVPLAPPAVLHGPAEGLQERPSVAAGEDQAAGGAAPEGLVQQAAGGRQQPPEVRGEPLNPMGGGEGATQE